MITYSIIISAFLLILIGIWNSISKNKNPILELILALISLVILFIDMIILKKSNAYFLLIISAIWVYKSYYSIKKTNIK